MPMQYAVIFKGCKNDSFWVKKEDCFHIFAQNIYCEVIIMRPTVYVLEQKLKTKCLP